MRFTVRVTTVRYGWTLIIFQRKKCNSQKSNGSARHREKVDINITLCGAREKSNLAKCIATSAKNRRKAYPLI